MDFTREVFKMLVLNPRLPIRRFCRIIATSSTFMKKQKTNDCGNGDVLDESDNKDYEELANRHFGKGTDHNCFIIHPYVKWGPRKVSDTKPVRQLEEAVALIRTLAPWRVVDTISVPLENLDKKQLFGSGTLDKLKKQIRSNKKITAVFINLSTLKTSQLEELELLFNVPIFDRYKIVMQILRLHAISKHAKLQVALAEIPYLKSRTKKHDTHFMASSDFDTKRLMLQNREVKLKNEIKKLRSQRELLRQKRREVDFPIVAVVGYTNAGKTSLIQALTGDANLQPRNQLFATLDVTMHAGLLPSNLEVLYVDTVGFISEIPTNLIECFVATLEDAMYADIILHVNDLSSEDYNYQKRHVLDTLENLAEKTATQGLLDKLISVGNKCDISKVTEDSGELAVSAMDGKGVDELKEMLENSILQVTDRRVITIRLPIGGDEIRWLYKNSTVVSVATDVNDNQLQNVKIIITKARFEKFKHDFVMK